ncbi:MAG: bifunctional diguanylate cyclase/phosphodiesterase [Burkholderiaceae bacterium]
MAARTAPSASTTGGRRGTSWLAALDELRTPVWVFDIDHRRVHWANPAALAVWRAASLDELRARDMGADMSATVSARLAQYQADFVSHGARFNEQWTLYPAGRPVSLHVHYSGFVLDDGRMAMLCEGQPIDAESPESLRSVDALLHTPMVIGLYDLEGRPLYRNPAARASARAPDETLAQRFADPCALQRLLDLVAREGQATWTMKVYTSDGQRWHEVSARRRLDAATGEAALLISEVDVTPLKHSEAQARFLSEHDVLTGLPNRGRAQRHFEELVQQVRAMSAASVQPPQQAALILIDLDRFKDINDTLGHAAGDELLVEVARRARAIVRHSDVVARFGGDEFLILLSGPDLRNEVARIHPRLRSALAQPFQLAGSRVQVSATVGASVFPDDGEDFATLLQRADLAMYQGKAGGRDALTFYQTGLSEQLHARTRLEEELRRALACHEFELHYQPRVCGPGQRVVGAEALVRWRHPQRGLVMPGEFIPICESTGLVRELGREVFAMAARQQAAWLHAGRRLTVSVNLSPLEFASPDLLEALKKTLDDTGCPPEVLELEITESMLIGDDERLMQTLHGLRDLGLSIALDDFGTGYSNLAYLQRFPFDIVKIDRSFVQAKASERPLTEAIIGLCRAMRLRPVAEGVETAAQHQWLRGLAVDEFQGYLFSPPLPPDRFEALLASGSDADAAPMRARSLTA